MYMLLTAYLISCTSRRSSAPGGIRFLHTAVLQGSRRATLPTMDPKLMRIIETINAHRKSGHSWSRGQLCPQPYYTYQDEKWQAGEITSKHPISSGGNGNSFSILSWNIDFMRSFTSERMEKALSFLHRYSSKITEPSIIMLSEMLVSDLQLIQAQSWVRDHYCMTDVSDEWWESGYYGKWANSSLPSVSAISIF